jgi:hypothetical protein
MNESQGHGHDTPVELRFVDLFLLIVAALVFIALVLILRGVSIGAPPTILTRALPPALQRMAYQVQLASTGGTPPLRWSIVRGVLPTGIEVRGGVIEGNAETNGRSMFELELMDSEGRAVIATMTLEVVDIETASPTVQQKPAFESEVVSMKDGHSNMPYRELLEASGGTLPYRFELAINDLPNGLTLRSDGELSGVPIVPPPSPWSLLGLDEVDRKIAKRRRGTSRFRIVATDGAGQHLTREVQLYVEPSDYPLAWQLILGEISSTEGFLTRLVSFAVRLLLFLLLASSLVTSIFPLAMFAIGYRAQHVPGLRGMVVRPSAIPSASPAQSMGYIRAPFAVTTRKLANLASGIRVAGGILFASAWAGGRELPESAPDDASGTRSSGPASAPMDLFAEPGARCHEYMDVDEDGTQSDDRSSNARKGFKAWLRAVFDGEDADDSKQDDANRRRHAYEQERASLWKWLSTRMNYGGSDALGADGADHSEWDWQTLLRRDTGDSTAHGGARGHADGEEEGEGNSDGGPPGPREDEKYLENLREGGIVRYGGAFLALPFLPKLQLERRVTSAFQGIPDVGRGLLQLSLEHFFRKLLGLRAPRSSEPRDLDRRFTVLLARRGPAPLPRPQKGEPRRPKDSVEGAQGRMIFPEINDEAYWPDGDPLFQAMDDSAELASQWLSGGVQGAESTDRRLLARLLRGKAHVRLEGDVVVVRVPPGRSVTSQVATESILQRLNAQHPRMVGRYRFAVKYLSERPPPQRKAHDKEPQSP